MKYLNNKNQSKLFWVVLNILFFDTFILTKSKMKWNIWTTKIDQSYFKLGWTFSFFSPFYWLVKSKMKWNIWTTKIDQSYFELCWTFSSFTLFSRLQFCLTLINLHFGLTSLSLILLHWLCPHLSSIYMCD